MNRPGFFFILFVPPEPQYFLHNSKFADSAGGRTAALVFSIH